MIPEPPAPASRETDAALAQGLFGWRDVEYTRLGHPEGWEWTGFDAEGRIQKLPAYSTDDPAALLVVERLRQTGWLVILKAMPDGFPFLTNEDAALPVRVRYVVEAQWMDRGDREGIRRYIFSRPHGVADTLALAVSRCALECLRAEGKARERQAEFWRQTEPEGQP